MSIPKCIPLLPASSVKVEERAVEYFFERHVADLQLYFAGFYFREVEYFVDKVEQVRTRVVYVAGELHLACAQRVVFVFCKQLCQDQYAVERCAQLVRHVGQELGFIAAGTFQQLCFTFDLGLGIL